MRMWKINPKLLCDQHLLGEHFEMHMFVGNIRKNKSIKGYVEKGLIEVHNIRKRHDKLANEMKKRGFNHKSPLKSFKEWNEGKVDLEKSKEDLRKRCPKCLKKLSN